MASLRRLVLLVTVVVVFVVAAQCSEAAQADSIGEEDLGPCIHPHLENIRSTLLNIIHHLHKQSFSWFT